MVDAIKNVHDICSTIKGAILELFRQEGVLVYSIGTSRINAILRESHTEFSFRVFVATTEKGAGHLLRCISQASSPTNPIHIKLYTHTGVCAATMCISK